MIGFQRQVQRPKSFTVTHTSIAGQWVIPPVVRHSVGTIAPSVLGMKLPRKREGEVPLEGHTTRPLSGIYDQA